MKRIIFKGLAAVAILLFCNMYAPDNTKVYVSDNDTKLPSWQWNSGEVDMHNTASGQSFSIGFNPSIYHAGDSVEITFASYKVSITGLNSGTTFKKWTGQTSLVYFDHKKWVPLILDMNKRINLPFSGENNTASDSLINYSIRVVIPASKAFIITSTALTFEMDEANGNGKPISTHGAPTFTTSIKGIEVEKIGKK